MSYLCANKDNLIMNNNLLVFCAERVKNPRGKVNQVRVIV